MDAQKNENDNERQENETLYCCNTLVNLTVYLTSQRQFGSNCAHVANATPPHTIFYRRMLTASAPLL